MDRGELNLHHWSKVGKEYICNRNEIQLSDLHGKQLHVDNLKNRNIYQWMTRILLLHKMMMKQKLKWHILGCTQILPNQDATTLSINDEHFVSQ